jgi:SAM-dependent methyltransferase
MVPMRDSFTRDRTPNTRADDIRRQLTVLSAPYRKEYLGWLAEITAHAVKERQATRILGASEEELLRLMAGHSEGRLGEAVVADARQHIRDLMEGLLAQPGVCAETKTRIRHFLADDLQPITLNIAGRRFTRDWFYYHEEHWRRHFGHLARRDRLRFLEIGSFEGRSACWMLENLLVGEGSCLVCVDPFTAYPGQEDAFDHNVRAAGAAHRVLKLRGSSEQVLHYLEKAAFDFVYVDGSHVGLDVVRDAAAVWKLVKPGGIAVFDDYGAFIPSFGEPSCKVGIDAFLGMVTGRYEILFSDWQLAVRKDD